MPSSLLDAFHDTLGEIGGSGSHPTDSSIHATRKTLKRARAALRLMRAGLGDTAYRSANRRLRDAAQPLTSVRDAAVLLDALKAIRKSRDKKALKRHAERVHRALQGVHRLQREQLTEETLRSVSEELRALDLQIGRMPPTESDAVSARRGITDTYRSGRDAFSKVRKHARVALLHEWRKQAKYLSNEVALAEQLELLKFKKARRQAERLAELLGRDHDLALLRAKLRELSQGEVPGRGAEHKRLEHRIAEGRSRLQRKALRLGAKLYGSSVKKFKRSL